ncbi:MAG: hypothetical protein OXJ55_17175 [Caldilineaceae bacterium]|nr:hypothetical protein [Caldilineaceae bacterium]
MKFFLPQQVRHDYWGFEALTQLHSQAEEYFLEEIEIDMGSTFWLDADMCAVFGAILYSLGDNLNTVNLVNIQPDVERILSKNGFLSHYGRVKIPDSWGTTISYQRFDVSDDRFFSGYIEAEFIHRIEMPEMSPGLLKKFRESIFEIFSNAVLHSGTRLGIFSCGQFFPKKNKLDFTVADLGVGIRQNVCEYTGLNLSASQAIAWATVENNTTKGGSVPGGLGLKLLGEFIDLNGGCLQIVSDDGYWQRVNRNSSSYALRHRFPGTVVNIEINTADTQSYVLTSELDVDEIF